MSMLEDKSESSASALAVTTLSPTPGDSTTGAADHTEVLKRLFSGNVASFVFIRHSQTNSPDPADYNGSHIAADKARILTEAGEAAAKDKGTWFSGLDAPFAICSAAMRCQKTCKVMSKGLDTEVIDDLYAVVKFHRCQGCLDRLGVDVQAKPLFTDEAAPKLFDDWANLVLGQIIEVVAEQKGLKNANVPIFGHAVYSAVLAHKVATILGLSQEMLDGIAVYEHPPNGAIVVRNDGVHYA